MNLLASSTKLLLCAITGLMACSPTLAAPPSALPESHPITPPRQPTAPPPDLADPLSPASLMAEIALLAAPALRGRGSATPDEQRAAAHLASALDSAGIAPLGDPPIRIQTFSVGTRKSQNVLGIIRPTDTAASNARAIVLGAHYDHLGTRGDDTYPGADDNASGTAAVLGVARALLARRDELQRPVIIAFFGAEEVGMRGSAAFLADGPIARDRLFAMVNVDMVGRPLSDKLLLLPLLAAAEIDPQSSVGVDGLRDRPGFAQIVNDACRAEQHRAVTLDDVPPILQPTIERLSRGRGDNWSFERAGVPAIFFSSAESSDYHQPTDTTDTLSPELEATRARIVLRTVVGLSRLTRP